MRRHRNAKIVATLGPASSSAECIHTLFKAGVDVFRLNFSHGTHADHKDRVEKIRRVEAETARPIAILMDLQGPKLRIGTFADGPVTLEAGQSFRLDLDGQPGDASRAVLPHREIFAALEPGTHLLLDDGKIRLRVIRTEPGAADTVVEVGGRLSERKGVNAPGVVLPISALTEKDRCDLEFGLSLGVDWVALSFVQRPEDVDEARRLIRGRALVMAKLEKPAALERLDAIVERSDGLMVARGDLGVELPPEDVPTLQRTILKACRRAGKPAIIATQMLESMILAPTPTRAEISDVATAIYEGADAVMLSAESASGNHPVEAVGFMDRIIRKIEVDPHYRSLIDSQQEAPEPTAADAISSALRRTAHVVGAKSIVAYTSSGASSLRAARERPEVPILSLTPHVSTARRMALSWGVHSALVDEVGDTDAMTSVACRAVIREHFARPGEAIVIAAGVPFGRSGSTNLLRVATVVA